MSSITVLVIEDDPAIRRGLVDALDFGGYRVEACEDGRSGSRTAISMDVDLVLLDVLLPGKDGFEVLEEIRSAKPTLPVIMVTARGAESDRVHGLKTGADDYVVKPFSAKELLARVEAVLRRSVDRPEPVRSVKVAGRTLNFERQEARLPGGKKCALSEREVAILRYLAAVKGRAVSRQELLQRVWGLDPRGVETRTVDMHVARLREKLEDDPADAKIVQTVRSKGYMLSDNAKING